MALDTHRALAAIGEATRFRILELLADGPQTVGEIAAAIGALQPQTTKHLQTMQAAGVVRVRRLGRRRVVSLDRTGMAELAGYFSRLADQSPASSADAEALDRYEQSIAEEESQLSAGGDPHRTLRFSRSLAAPAPAIWAAWTDRNVAARWWAPRHFSVTRYELDPVAGGAMHVALREGDGATYESVGRVISASPGRRLVFDLAPVDEAGHPLFEARHSLALDEEDDRTTLTLEIDATVSRLAAAAAAAGLEQGWEQLLDQLEIVLTLQASTRVAVPGEDQSEAGGQAGVPGDRGAIPSGLSRERLSAPRPADAARRRS